MRVGIITFHCSYNFGSALQAYALQRAIGILCDTVRIVDYRSADYNQYHLFRPLRPWKMAWSPSILGRLIERKRGFLNFSANRLNLTPKKYSYHNESRLEELQNTFDVFICGSDQIWNLDCTGGVVEPFFLSFAGDRRRIAYAPSLAHTSFNPKNYDKGRVAALLSDFDFLSVREEETIPLFQPLVNKRIEVVLDPTLLLDADAYADMADTHVEKHPYVFMYLLRECPELIESATAMGAEGACVIYISEKDFAIPNSKNLFGAGPEEFVSLIVHADAVLTNSFHAVVFSVLFHKPFRVFAIDKSSSRMRDLLGKLGIPERCVSSVDASPVEDANWDEVDRKLEELRVGSWDFLRRALSNT